MVEAEGRDVVDAGRHCFARAATAVGAGVESSWRDPEAIGALNKRDEGSMVLVYGVDGVGEV